MKNNQTQGKEFQQLVELPLEQKVDRSFGIIKTARKNHKKIAAACSAGKDSMAVAHLVKHVDPSMPIFSIMTPFKPKESFTYLKEMDEDMHLNLKVYFAGNEVPEEMSGMDVILMPELWNRFNVYAGEIRNYFDMKELGDAPPLYLAVPSLCCDLLKTSPTKEAVKNLDAWICGLRNTEGRTRGDYQEVEERGQGLVKINPILIWTEEDVWQYMKQNKIKPHPWYEKEFSDGRKVRSLGCEPCTAPIHDNQDERDGRWQGTSKCGGECGIHTQPLKIEYE